MQLNYETKIIESKNLGTLYRHINSRLIHKDGIAPICDSDGNLIVDNALKVKIVNNHFVNVGKPDNGNLKFLPQKFLKRDISSISFNAISIFKIISELKINSSPRPDGIPTILLKNLKNVLSHPLSILFELIFQFVQLPNQWKTAIVKPMFKKGS